MRTLPLLLAGLALGLGLATVSPAHAHGSDARIWVSLGDVVFSAGHPYHRHLHHPLHVVRVGTGPRYYYHPAPRPIRHYPAPRHYGHGHGYGYSYAPAPYLHRPGHGSIHRPYRQPPRPGYPRQRPGYWR